MNHKDHIGHIDNINHEDTEDNVKKRDGYNVIIWLLLLKK
jgi:hypothetical protein